MPRIQTSEECDQNRRFSKNCADVTESHSLFGHGPDDFRTTKGSVLDLERSTVTQALVPFISHDIRHHLASIYCNIEFMSDPDIGHTDREQLLAEVRGTIHDMTDLLDSFLLSVRTGKTLHIQPKSINLLVQHAVGMVRSHPDAQECELVICDAPPIEARIDSQRLGTAVYNLLLNACQASKACSPPKRVEIALWHDNSSIRIRVKDNGHGVPDCIRNVLFQSFVSTEKASGTGLGLTIAEQAAREHGGCLYLEESVPGKTIFVLQLPNLALEAPLTGEHSE
jgi:signal transduction histidine kinase